MKLETAMREAGADNRMQHERGAMESAFRTLETRGASDADYQRLIYRMQYSSDDASADVGALLAAIKLRLL